jgi:alkyl sulfatase BDS1-like metallo-beta-lactamase superfamily hydrolase
VVDGVRIVFQLTPGTEAPAEMNFYFPHRRALCTAENTSHTLHNILTIRGAQVRDAQAWSAYLTETIALWGDELDVVFASHHWPTWGRERAVEFLSVQRDMYAYLHDQTLRLMNQGWVGREIAEMIELPPALEAAWHVHGYYGSVSHNVKAIYQRYMGWYEGNPARLWTHPPVAAGERYVRAMGGADAAVAEARRALDEGDLRWAAEVLDHVIFADEHHEASPGPAGRRPRADRLRRRERDLAQRVPVRRPRAAPRQQRHARVARLPRPGGGPHRRADPVLGGHPGGSTGPGLARAPHRVVRHHRREHGARHL